MSVSYFKHEAPASNDDLTITPVFTIEQVIRDIEIVHAAKAKKIRLNFENFVNEIPVLAILNHVANECDGAVSRDNTGFCRDDLNKDVHGLLAYLSTDAAPHGITYGGLEWALFMCIYYQRQWQYDFPPYTLTQIKELQRKLETYWN